MKEIVGFLMLNWVTLEIWRKLFLAPRNLHAQVGRNLWHVESNYALYLHQPFFFWSYFFSKNSNYLQCFRVVGPIKGEKVGQIAIIYVRGNFRQT
jgi:hypothetical protein